MSAKKVITVALVGNPNSGKTSLFNELVGANQKVGNFSGVTIEKYEGKVTYQGYQIKVIDLPGTYSLTAYSPEELVARNFIINEKPDVVIDVVDGSNIERNLYLTTQIMELEANMIVALNMYDEVERNEVKIDVKQLQTLLGSHVIPTSAVKKTGIDSLLDHVIRVFNGDITIKKNKLSFRFSVEEQINKLTDILAEDTELADSFHLRWLAIKIFEQDQEVYQVLKERPIWMKIDWILHDSYHMFAQKFESDAELLITEDRHAFIHGAIAETVAVKHVERKTVTEYIDSILINRILGFPLFLLIIWSVFQFTFRLGAQPIVWMESIFDFIGNSLTPLLPEGVIQSIVVDGIIGGVGGVVVFLPNILLLFIALSFLEGTGYMARAAFVVDKLMHLLGLHGKSFIPMITGFGCSIPAMMATRTLKNKADRLTTMMVIPFMSCGAKLPVYVLLISAFFAPKHAGNVLFAVYLFGVVIAMLSARLLKATFFKGSTEPFVMELPPYRLPRLRLIITQAMHKAWMYLKKAGTIILGASILIWVLSNYPYNMHLEREFDRDVLTVHANPYLTDARKEEEVAIIKRDFLNQQLEYSMAGRIGKFIEPVLMPLGFDWRIGIALVTGLAAKEVVVSTLGTIYSLGDVDETSFDLVQKLRADPHFSKATAISLMVFVLLYVPCIATIGVFKKESGSWKWVGIYSVYALVVAWMSSFMVFQWLT